MVFTDLFSSSFLFSIAIIIILIGAIFAYVSYRMSEQDHKITSMLGLVSTMAEEMAFFRSKLSKIQEQEQEQEHNHHTILVKEHEINMVNDDLISVSDESINEESSDSDSDSESDSESDSDSIDLETEPISNIKSIHLEEPIDLHENCDHGHDHTHIILSDLTNDMTEDSFVSDSLVSDSLSNDLKTISIMDLEEPNKITNDYKKMSITKLREIVVEKELIDDASKLKKPELIKLLEDSLADK